MAKKWWRKYSKRWLGEEFEPFSAISSMKDEIDSMFESFLGAFPRRAREGIRAPLIDIKETEKEVIVTAELPGVKKEDIKLRVENTDLIIEAEARVEKGIEEEGFIQRERGYTGYKRVISLPAEVVPRESSAKYENGILTIKLQKVKPTKPRGEEIEIE